MCLATVFKNDEETSEPLCEKIASATKVEGGWEFVDLLGDRTFAEGDIVALDFSRNAVYLAS